MFLFLKYHFQVTTWVPNLKSKAKQNKTKQKTKLKKTKQNKEQNKKQNKNKNKIEYKCLWLEKKWVYIYLYS